MGNMPYLKNDRKLFFSVFIIFPFFYFDKTVVTWIKDVDCNVGMYHLGQALNPLVAFFSHGATLIAFSIVLYLFGRFRNQRIYDAGKSLFIGLVSTGLVVQGLKHIIGRARPRITFDPVFIGPSVKSGFDSFPSGHTALAFCLAFILSEYFPRYRIMFYLFAVTVGWYRLDGLSHFPSDVIAGAVVGTAVAKVLSIGIFRSKRPVPQST
jgi:membrane-associated phospholipid phosphatase